MDELLALLLGNEAHEIPSLSAKEGYVLRALQRGGEQYGLELVKNSGGQLKRGTVYVVLGRLEDKSYIESRLEPKQPGAIGRPRRLYTINGTGESLLARYAAAALLLAGES